MRSKEEICTSSEEQFKLEEFEKKSIVSLKKRYSNFQKLALQGLFAVLREMASLKGCFRCPVFGRSNPQYTFDNAHTASIVLAKSMMNAFKKGEVHL